jgi:hypothetical protein
VKAASTAAGMIVGQLLVEQRRQLIDHRAGELVGVD